MKGWAIKNRIGSTMMIASSANWNISVTIPFSGCLCSGSGLVVSMDVSTISSGEKGLMVYVVEVSNVNIISEKNFRNKLSKKTFVVTLFEVQ